MQASPEPSMSTPIEHWASKSFASQQRYYCYEKKNVFSRHIFYCADRRAICTDFSGRAIGEQGVAASTAANIWVREVGVLLIAVGITAFLVRSHEDSPTLKAFFIGNIILQLGLIPIEPIAYVNGIVTKLSGIMPNTILHVLLAGGFAYYAAKMKIQS